VAIVEADRGPVQLTRYSAETLVTTSARISRDPAWLAVIVWAAHIHHQRGLSKA